MSERRLGVVIPAFNEQETIPYVLDALYNQRDRDGIKVFLVNNASTDNTREVVEEFGRNRADFPLVILDEDELGTGSASDAGFLGAIEEGYPLIARTDADTLPDTYWTRNIIAALEDMPHVQLLGGSRFPLKDEEYRRRDSILWPAGMMLGDLACKLTAKDRRGSRVVTGCNMATRAGAYIRVGGFPHTKIEDADEDAVYVERIVQEYGTKAIDVRRNIKVRTSMRRVRALGYMTMFTYRFSSLISDGHR